MELFKPCCVRAIGIVWTPETAERLPSLSEHKKGKLMSSTRYLEASLMRRVWKFTSVFAVGALVLAGCAATDSASDDGATELVWANDAAWHQEGQDALGAASLESFGINVTSEIFPTTDAYQAQVRSSLNTADAYPLFDWWFGYRMQDLAEQGLLQDISDIWDEAIGRGEYPADLKNVFSWDGVAYGLPKLVNYWGVFYNKNVFSKYDLEIPTTWDDLISVCETLKSNGVYCFGQQISDRSWASFIWFQEILVRSDPALYNGILDGSVAYDDPRVVEAVGVWADFIQKEYITPTSLLNSDNAVQEFADGTYAMQLIGDWTGNSLNDAGLSGDTDYGFFVMPGMTDAGSRALIVEARVSVLPKASSKAEKAKEFAKYFLSVDGATVWAKTAGINSPNLKVAADTRPDFLVELGDRVSAGDFDLYQRYWEGTPTPVVDAVYPLLGKIAENPADYKAILAEAQAAAQAAWPGR
jgi:ABC-type glycerol-3-phosphate transport system substrate-binding protein